MKRTLPVTFIVSVLLCSAISPVAIVEGPEGFRALPTAVAEHIDDIYAPSWMPSDRIAKVAIYDEPNVTLPDYAAGIGSATNNISEVAGLLESAGYEVTLLTFQDILNHELMTSRFDVFVMVNNLPRENISNYVREFWLGGGGVLSFSRAISYMFYFGLFGPEFERFDPVYGYWGYAMHDVMNVTGRHPVTKAYHPKDNVTERENSWIVFSTYMWDTESSVVKNDAVTLLDNNTWPDWGLACAIDNSYRGGRVVHLPGDGYMIPSDFESIIVNAIDWLVPRPKGRIVFDLTHRTINGMDSWDDLSTHEGYISQFRDLLVNHTYTIDKLYPESTGNLTVERLHDYDILILQMPLEEYTSSEISAVQDYVSTGGSLLAIGDEPLNAAEQLGYINSVTQAMGLAINDTKWIGTPSVFPMEFFTLEGCMDLYIEMCGYVNITSEKGVGLWGDWPDFYIGSTYYGDGRIVLSADSHWIQNSQISNDDNARFVLNAANWLTATDPDAARVLVYQSGIEPGNNEYRSALVDALNELGIEFMLHTDPYYFNLSIFWEQWDLVVVDANSNSLRHYYSPIKEHLESGGKLIMQDSYFYHNPYEIVFDVSLFTYLGFEGTNNRITSGPPAIQVWDYNHGVFNHPIDYGAHNISSTRDWFATDFCNVTLYANATPLAGVTKYQDITKAAIAESVDGRAISNFFALTEYNDDTDDSTYPDSYELWMNEIAYMMRPTIDKPDDIVTEHGSAGMSITWHPSSDRPYWFELRQWTNGGMVCLIMASKVWDGGPITALDLASFPLGEYVYQVTVWDTAGLTATDSVTVIVQDTTSPALVDGPDNLQYQQGTVNHLLNWTFLEYRPDAYMLYINGSTECGGPWDGSEISVDVGGLTQGVYNVTLAVNDTSGNLATSTVFLTVTASSTTSTSTTTTTTDTTETTDTTTNTSTLPIDGNTTLVIIAIIAATAVVASIIAITKRKRT